MLPNEYAQSNLEIDFGSAVPRAPLGNANMFHLVRWPQSRTHKIMPVVGLPCDLVPLRKELRRRIMIIGDETDILLVAALLLASGYEILTVEDVNSALDAFDSGSDISLVLLHCNAPKSEACKASARLRTRFPWLPIVRFGGKSESSSPAGRYVDYHHPEDHPIANLIRAVHVLLGRSDSDMN